jgi:predicted PurR-regulated permease PerM
VGSGRGVGQGRAIVDLRSEAGPLASVLNRRSRWIEAFIVLGTVAVFFVVLGFLAAYFRDYFHLGLIFLLAWLLASLVSPVADYLQHRLRHLPRVAAVLGITVPVILVGALISARLVALLVESLAGLATLLPGLIANPPSIVTDAQAWLSDRGVALDLDATYRATGDMILSSLGGGASSVIVGASGVFGIFADALTIITLAIFMAVDRERILQFGIDLVPPEGRRNQLLFRRSVGSAFSGFIRSQLITGAAYGLWSLAVSLVFGLPFAAGTAFLSGIIMSIPIYGPYVSWLPPVVVAVLVGSSTAPLVAFVMLVGWFINQNLLAPLVRSDQLQVNPIVVTFAFLLGAQLAGPIGAIIAIPLVAVAQAFYIAYRDQYGPRTGREPQSAASASNSADAAQPGDQSP